MKKKLIYTLITILALALALFFIRLFSHTELDDVSPEIPCEQEYLEKSDILWVIPLFNNKSISSSPEWCSQILELNKTLGLHGVYHTYKELSEDRDHQYIESGISAFEECFGYKPGIFKPSHLSVSKNNRIIIENEYMKLHNKLNQLTHKVYHCSDTGVFSNKLIDLF